MKLFYFSIVFILVFPGCNSNKNKSDKQESNLPKKIEPKIKKTTKVDKKTNSIKKEQKIQLASIPVCDKYVKSVCACSKKHPDSYEMKRACKSAKDTYPQWKRDSSKSKEEQEVIIKACQKGLLYIKASPNQCEDK